MKKIVFVGGHHTPALAVVDALARKCQIFWIGHKYSMWGDKNVSAECQEVTRRGIPFYDLKAGKLYKTFHPRKLIRLPFGFLQAFYYLLKIRPQLIVSFGGYLSPPVVIAGWLMGIPSVTHEQSASGGWANRLVAKFAKKIFVSWEESLKYFPKEKTTVTGNPLRKEIFVSRHSDPERSEGEESLTNVRQPETSSEILRYTQDDRRTIYITGGKQGSHVLNVAVGHALPELLKKYNIIHQCGRSSVFDDRQELSSGKEELNSDLRSRYILQDYFTEEEIGPVFAAADVVISRAGANIVYELAALGKPAILIPIPWVSHDEQHKNAEVLANAGSALILEEKDLTSESLTVRTDELFANLEKFKEGGQRAQKFICLDAADRIAEEIAKILGV